MTRSSHRSPDLERTFQRWCAAISAFESLTSNALGYRFLYCPRANLWDHNGVLLLGLNPGGKLVSRGFEAKDGLAYRVEAWRGRNAGEHVMQEQVMRLLSALSADPERTLCSNLIFFRSPSWKDLQEKHEVTGFCGRLWTDVLTSVSKFDLRIFLGKVTYDTAARTVAGLKVSAFDHEIPLWAGGRVLIACTPGQPMTLVLPHLSRWRFVREGNQAFDSLVALVRPRLRQ